MKDGPEPGSEDGLRRCRRCTGPPLLGGGGEATARAATDAMPFGMIALTLRQISTAALGRLRTQG